MDIVPKPRHMCVGTEHTSAKELLLSVAKLPIDDAIVAVVVIQDNQLHTYQFGCDGGDLLDCAEALEAYSHHGVDKDVPIAEPN